MIERRYLRFRPRRARCQECRRTHVVLPDRTLLRRLDRVEVIGAALTDAACGVGVRTISRRLQLPAYDRARLDQTLGGPLAATCSRAGRALRSARDDHSADTPTLSPGARWRQVNRESNGSFLS